MSLLYNRLGFASGHLLKNLFLLMAELSPFTCIAMTFTLSSVILHFVYYFDIPHFIDSKICIDTHIKLSLNDMLRLVVCFVFLIVEGFL